MKTIEFSAQAGKVFSVQLYEGLDGDAVGGTLVPVEDPPTRYRVNVAIDAGIFYVIASATNLTVAGYVNLSAPGDNSCSEILDTYDEAVAQGGIAPTPPITDIQPSDVRAGVTYLDSLGATQTGTLQLPAEDQVLAGIGYGALGTEYVGTMPAATVVTDSTVQADGMVRSPLWIGTAYLTDYGNGFTWRVMAPEGLEPADVEVRFRGRLQCSKSFDYAWDVVADSVTKVTVSGVNYWDIDVSLTLGTTLAEGTYRWWLVAEALTSTIVLRQYSDYTPLKLLKG